MLSSNESLFSQISTLVILFIIAMVVISIFHHGFGCWLLDLIMTPFTGGFVARNSLLSAFGY